MRAAVKTKEKNKQNHTKENTVQTSWGTAVEFLFFWTGPWEIPFGTCYPIFVRLVFEKELQKSHLALLLWLAIKNTNLVWQTFCTQITSVGAIWCVKFTVMDLHSLFFISPAIEFCMLLSPKDCMDISLYMLWFYVSHIPRGMNKCLQWSYIYYGFCIW